TVALAVFSFIRAAFGITAGQNTPKQLIEIEQDDTDDDLDLDAVDAELDELNGETEDYTPGAHAAGLVDSFLIDRTAAYCEWCGSLSPGLTLSSKLCEAGSFFDPKNGYNQTNISGTPDHAQHA